MTSRFGTPIRHAEQGCKDRPALNLKQLLSVLTKMYTKTYMTRFPNRGDQAQKTWQTRSVYGRCQDWCYGLKPSDDLICEISCT